MSSDIYLVSGDGAFTKMVASAYEAEVELQKLLAKFPELLSDPKGATNPWLLVSRETGIPSKEAGSDRWAIDHLFLDADGIPTLVEVKRSSDTRIRREVVGQMLDYAANAVLYWPVEKLIGSFEATCEARGADPTEEILSMGTFESPGAFWERVETNLRAGKIRLLFVADEVPDELQRIVEFLNEQMDQAEILAIEVRKYSGGAQEALVPRLLGQTAQAKMQKRRSHNAAFSSKLVAVVEKFHSASANEWQSSGNGRLIYAWPDYTELHYEFTDQDEATVGVELHIESNEVLAVRPYLESLEGTTMAGRPLSWDPNYWKGRGRIYLSFPETEAADTIAEGMTALIKNTRPRITELLMQAANGG